MAIEVERSSTPRPGKGFLLGCDDVGATERYYVVPGARTHPIGKDTEAVGVVELIDRLVG